jgi:hypothetical protein
MPFMMNPDMKNKLRLVKNEDILGPVSRLELWDRFPLLSSKTMTLLLLSKGLLLLSILYWFLHR